MYTVTVRSHIMIAHSLPDKFFGPAAKLHGATYVIDAEFRSEELNDKNVVIDIGEAHKCLDEIGSALNYRNLDEEDCFAGQLTTTEFLARHIHDELSRLLAGKFRGFLKITLNESHVASAGYEARIG